MGLQIDFNKGRTGFKAVCTDCGKRLRTASSCNRSGLWYAISGAVTDYLNHTDGRCHPKKEAKKFEEKK